MLGTSCIDIIAPKIERGQCRVAFEGHANVFGPFNTNRVVM